MIYGSPTTYYVPKTDYVAFCLPVLAVSLGQILTTMTGHALFKLKQYFSLTVYMGIFAAILFLFYIQDIKNGMAYATLCMTLFTVLLFVRYPGQLWRKALVFIAVTAILATFLHSHIQKNQTWRVLVDDTRVALQLDKYPQWKDQVEINLPLNKNGQTVSATTYLRVAWFMAGVKLALETPMGYGLVEDSFKKMVKMHWPEASLNFSHTHSGWLDLTLALGFPGLICILCALIFAIRLSRTILYPWKQLIFWALVSTLLLWGTTEVAATVSFPLLIFWVCWAGGLVLSRCDPKATNL
jgi:O-antigen ligase